MPARWRRGDVGLVRVKAIPQQSESTSSANDRKLRPCVIVRGDHDGEPAADYRRTIVVPLTKKLPGVKYGAGSAMINPSGDGVKLEYASVADCTFIYTIPEHALERSLGTLNARAIESLDKALRYALGLPF